MAEYMGEFSGGLGGSNQLTRKKLLNRKLSRMLLNPKNAMHVLHELKPECIYKVEDNEGQFFAEVECDGVVLGKGEAPTKDRAKLAAAECAVAGIIVKSIVKRISPDEDTDDEDDTIEYENLPWMTLASYAVNEMFRSWNIIEDKPPINLEEPVPEPVGERFTQPVADAVVEAILESRTDMRRLPRKALDKHPVTVLNYMHPGLTPVELEHTVNPSRYTIGYEINGRMYTGMGVKKKEAKKEAAKTALKALYGLDYP